MSLLYRVVYAAHANGTHHKLALDALRHLNSPEAERWRRLFLEHVEIYLDGAKAPDTQFKDFRNHVLHVRDGYWGGAVDKAESWYGQLVVALTHQRWSEAVYAAGILSHYVTDPLQPFHTAQSEAENNIHRAVEWSISKSYDELKAIGETGTPAVEVVVGPKAGWLRDLVCRGAEIANSHYERLIAHYDIHRGVIDPPTGLDAIAKGAIADLLVYAARSYAAILDRAFAEARATPPNVNLTGDMVVATLKVPVKWITRKLADAADRRLVERMYDELMTTGRVEQNLPADDRIVRDLHRAEVLDRQAAAVQQQRTRLITKAAARAAARKPAVTAKPPPARAGAKLMSPKTLASQLGIVPPSQPAVTPTAQRPVQANAPLMANTTPAPIAPAAAPVAVQPKAAPSPVQASTSAIAIKPPAAVAPMPAPVSVWPKIAPVPSSVPSLRPGGDTFHLMASDDLEKAPSIGPKTALRFAPHGIKTVADFLAADPAAISAKVATRYITPQIIIDWQDQARLVMRVPGLRGTHAQLLVGAGFRSVEAIAKATPEALCAAILTFAATPDGQHVLRDGKPPDLARIKTWCDSARQAKAA